MKKVITEENYREVIRKINDMCSKYRVIVDERSLDFIDKVDGHSNWRRKSMKSFGHGTIYTSNSFCRAEEHPCHKAYRKANDTKLSEMFKMTGDTILLSLSLNRFFNLKIGDTVTFSALSNAIIIRTNDFSDECELIIKRDHNGQIHDIELENDLRNKEIEYNFSVKGARESDEVYDAAAFGSEAELDTFESYKIKYV